MGYQDENLIFQALRDWFMYGPNARLEDGDEAKETLRTSTQLAEALGTRKQLVTPWATGADGRKPSLATIIQVVKLMPEAELVITADGCAVMPRRKAGPNTVERKFDEP